MTQLVEKFSAELANDQEYMVNIEAFEDRLIAQVEEKITGFIWKNIFTVEQVEAITQQAGSFRKYDIFVNMLAAALSGEGEFVALDVYSQLKELKLNRFKHSPQTQDPSQADGKRYIILTHVFDSQKVSFPLPLNFEDNLDPESMKATIRKMRARIEELQAAMSHMKSRNFKQVQAQDDSPANREFMDAPDSINLKTENEMLKEKCRKLEEVLTMLTLKNKSVGALEFDLLLKSKLELENHLDDIKKEHIKELKKYQERVSFAVKELEDARFQLNLHRKNDSENKHNFCSSNKSTATQHSEEDQVGLAMSKSVFPQHRKQIEALSQEIDHLRSTEASQKIRIKQLEKELANALKRAVRSQTLLISKKNSQSTQMSSEDIDSPTKNFEIRNKRNMQKKVTEKERPSSLDHVVESPQVSSAGNSATLKRKNSHKLIQQSTDNSPHNTNDKNPLVDSAVTTIFQSRSLPLSRSTPFCRKTSTPLSAVLPNTQLSTSNSPESVQQKRLRLKNDIEVFSLNSLVLPSGKSSCLQSPSIFSNKSARIDKPLTPSTASIEKLQWKPSLTDLSNKVQELDDSIDAHEINQRIKRFPLTLMK